MSKTRINETQEQLDEVVGIMKNNINYVIERDNKINDLEDRASQLENNAKKFQSNSMKIKRKMWLKDLKFKLIIGGIITGFIILLIVYAFKGNNNN